MVDCSCLEHTVFLSVTPLKMGLQVRGVARVHDDSPAKLINGLLLLSNHASIIRGKTKVLFVLQLGFTIWSYSFTVDLSGRR